VSLKSTYIALLEQVLVHLKNAKLAYLRAADIANQTEDKRYYNQQALLRNRFFQTILSQLQRENITLDDLVIRNFNFDQLLISSLHKLKAGAIEKCLEADTHLQELYEKIVALPMEQDPFVGQLDTIQDAIDHSQSVLPTYQLTQKN